MTVYPLRIRWLAVVTVLAIVVVLSACSDDPAPTPEPMAAPTATPTNTPTSEPTAAPTATPTSTPTSEPTAAPTATPTNTPAPTPTATPAPAADDRAALVALYEATDGANWTNNTNWLSDEPLGQWSGVETDDNGRVIQVSFYENQLSGEIPAELGSLANLEILNLWDNQLSGEIPTELGSLANLERLYLSGNQLSGEIPAELGSLANLERLYLSGNQLSGEIPMELGDLANLTELSLWDNQLSGEIPMELGDLANLTELDLGYNQLSGEIPTELGSLANLTELDLGYNQLSGEIPMELGGLANLEKMVLSSNQLSGEIPMELGDLANLEWLSLWDNQLSGEIPMELGGLANLEWLSLYSNQLSGEIPTELGSLANLETMVLSSNQLSGEIPTELGNLANLEFLDLSSNQLSGEIPPELGNLANLETMDLSGNDLSGCVPSSLQDQLNMDWSDLGGLLFCGATALPAVVETDRAALVELYEATDGANWRSNDNWLSDRPIGEWYGVTTDRSGRVTELSLDFNQLSGEIPGELGSLVNLQELFLSENQLSGEIPAELGNLPNLEWLGLGRNRLSGEIPAELGNLANLQYLFLSENQLNGEIPAELGNLTNLEWLGLGRNRLSGEIPAELGNLANLQYLFLSENQLSGEIPAELGYLANLVELNFSVNQLTGTIPAELGNLANLQYLFLSENQLSGEIPAELGNLPNLLALYLSGNRLTRCLPEGLREIQESDLNIMSIRPPLCGTTPASMIAAGGTIAVLQSLESLSDAHRRAGTEFEWSQVSGPPVELLDANAEYARFTAPVVVEDTILVFVLKAEYQNDVTVIDTVPIRVVPIRTERVLAALVDFLDVDPRERPFTREDIVKLLEDNDDSLSNYIAQTSRNLVNTNFDIVDWITVNKNRTGYPPDGGSVVEDVVSRMSDSADLSQYDKVMPLIFPLEQGNPGCQAYLDKVHWNTPNGRFRLGALWLSGDDMGCVKKGRIAHEFGHTFGFVHSYVIECYKEPPLPASMTDPTDMNDSCYANYCTNDDCTETSPGDAGIIANKDFDMLGGDHDHRYESFFPVHFHATWQGRAGWLAEAQIVTAESGGEYWLTALESLTPTPKAVRIFLGTDHEGNSLYYLIQYREFSPWSMGSLNSGQQVESSCQADVRLEASNISERGLFNTYFFSGYIDGVSVDSISRPGKPLWDPYRGIRIEILDCIDTPIGGVVRMQVNFSKLDIDPPVVAIFDTDGKATIKMTNNGSVPIDVGSASIGGRHPTAFVVDSDECSDSTMKSKASCEIILSHVPTDTEDDEPNNHGVLKIPNNDALAPEMTVSLFAANANR